MTSLFTGIDHASISCGDIKRQIAWYCDTLEMRVIASNGQDPPSVILGYDDDARGGAMIELMPVKDAGPAPAETPRFAPGLRHLALRVNDFDKALERLKDSGAELLLPAGTAVGGGRIVSFRDPEGNELQIVER